MDKLETLIDGLNEEQKAAVLYGDGPLKVIAGAGSGKTRVLTHRIAKFIAEGATPSSILAITFTNKAAQEMKDRLGILIGDDIVGVIRDENGLLSRTRWGGMWVQTFHAACARILRSEAHRLNYSQNFTIYDTGDALQMIRRCAKDCGIDVKRLTPAKIARAISSAKNELIDFEEYRELAVDQEGLDIARVYEQYVLKMHQSNAMDFDDLLVKTVEVFSIFEQVKEYYRDKFKYILVDEWQDTNKAQYEIVKLLGAPNGNVTIVGDADQSIYGFRGADIRNILDFDDDYPNAKQILLEQNYRSTKNILDVANGVIVNNRDRIEKNLRTTSSEGSKVVIHHAETDVQEALYIVNKIKDMVSAGEYSPKDFIVLYRTNAQSRSLEEAFISEQQQYQLVGGQRFYDRKEIKDVLAYLNILVNPADDVAAERVINTPKRGIGDTSIEHITNYAANNSMTFLEAAKNAQNVNQLSNRAQKAIATFTKLVKELEELVQKGEQTLSELIEEVVNLTGIRDSFVAEDTPEAQARLENINSLIQGAEDFASRDIDIEDEGNGLASYLERISLLNQQDTMAENSQRVTLMTIHNAKGLEYPVVFVAGLEEGLLPHDMSVSNPWAVEEERRLAYVAITRAEKRLFLTRAKTRSMYGKTNTTSPSRFLSEVPLELTDIKTKPSRVKQLQNRRKDKDLSATNSDFVLGQIVEHGHFGRGVVIDIPENKNQEIVIKFNKVGQKRLSLVYANLKAV